MGGVWVEVCVSTRGCWCLRVGVTTKCDGDCYRFLFGRQGCPSIYVGFVWVAIWLICSVVRLVRGALQFARGAP